MGLEGLLLYPWVIESIARQDEEALHFILETERRVKRLD